MRKALPDSAQPDEADQSTVFQLDKFKAAARELGTDDDPEEFKATVQKIGRAKPVKWTSEDVNGRLKRRIRKTSLPR